VTPRSILACRDARAAHWQLGPLPPARARLTLVGWTRSGDEQDGGLPEEVGRVLASALASVARVTFPSSRTNTTVTRVWSSFDGGLIRELNGPGVVKGLVAKMRGTPVDAALVSTRQPDVAMRAFDDAGFPWWLQGQAILLSKPDADPPDVDEPTLLALFEDDWAERAAGLAAIEVQGVVRPGVDGAVAGMLALREDLDRSLLDALERETRLAGLTWSIVPEAAL
jgi:hypothetical protein